MGYFGTQETNRTKAFNVVIASYNDMIAKKCFRGNVMWVLTTKNTIACFLFVKIGNGEWGYKGIPDYDGPSYYTCPKSYIKAGIPALPILKRVCDEKRGMVVSNLKHHYLRGFQSHILGKAEFDKWAERWLIEDGKKI